MSAAVSMHLNAAPQRQQAGGRRQQAGRGWPSASESAVGVEASQQKNKKQKREQNVVQKKQDKTFDLGEIQSDNK